jgi:hypothetical protein
MKSKAVVLFVILILLMSSSAAFASPWAENKTYLGKTGGKLKYGIKNSVFGWMQMFAEAEDPKYQTKWNGFCVGMARSVVYTASGLIHLATFPIPVDFPDVGHGL